MIAKKFKTIVCDVHTAVADLAPDKRELLHVFHAAAQAGHKIVFAIRGNDPAIPALEMMMRLQIPVITGDEAALARFTHHPEHLIVENHDVERLVGPADVYINDNAQGYRISHDLHMNARETDVVAGVKEFLGLQHLAR